MLAAGPERVVRVGIAERVRGVLDRPVAGAAAEVAAERVQIEAVGAVFVIGCLTGSHRIDVAVAGAALGRGAVGVGLGLGGALGVAGRSSIRPVVLADHRADEARRAVAALRATPVGHLLLHRVQGLDRAEAFGGQHLLTLEAGGGHQAGVDRRPATAAIRLRPVDQHGAGAAFALGATFLAPGQPVLAQPVEKGDVSAHIPEGTIEAIDCQLRFHRRRSRRQA